jgi:hypothetical protein
VARRPTTAPLVNLQQLAARLARRRPLTAAPLPPPQQPAASSWAAPGASGGGSQALKLPLRVRLQRMLRTR